MPFESLTEIILRRALARPSSKVIEFRDRELDGQWLIDAAGDMAAGLRARGIGPGDIVAIRLPNIPEQCALLIATSFVGATSLPIRHDGTDDDVAHVLDAVEIALLVSHIDLPPSRKTPTASIASLMGNQPSEPIQMAPVEPDTPFRISMTSGTTGLPKLLVNNHAVSLDRIRLYQATHGWSEGERYYLNMPMGDPWGVSICLAMLVIGGTIVIPGDSDHDEIRCAREKRITTMVMLPWFLKKLLAQASTGDDLLLPDLKSLVSSASRLAREDIQAVRTRITPRFFHVYGSTEVPYMAVQGPDRPTAAEGSLGQPMDNVEVEVVDDDGQPAPAGKPGLIRARRSLMIEGYLNNNEATARHFRDGWYYPLDVGYLDHDGNLFLVGRADDVINTQGAKFYPVEVERIIREVEDIEDVAVFAFPHVESGEVAAAAFVTGGNPNPVSLDRHCRGKLPGYKVPRYYLRVNEIPRNRNGKVDVHALRQRLDESLAPAPSDSCKP